jgi:hypothetical protein
MRSGDRSLMRTGGPERDEIDPVTSCGGPAFLAGRIAAILLKPEIFPETISQEKHMHGA